MKTLFGRLSDVLFHHLDEKTVKQLFHIKAMVRKQGFPIDSFMDPMFDNMLKEGLKSQYTAEAMAIDMPSTPSTPPNPSPHSLEAKEKAVEELDFDLNVSRKQFVSKIHRILEKVIKPTLLPLPAPSPSPSSTPEKDKTASQVSETSVVVATKDKKDDRISKEHFIERNHITPNGFHIDLCVDSKNKLGICFVGCEDTFIDNMDSLEGLKKTHIHLLENAFRWNILKIHWNDHNNEEVLKEILEKWWVECGRKDDGKKYLV